MNPNPGSRDRAAQLLALATAGGAVVLVLWNLSGIPWDALGLVGEHARREQGVVIAVLATASALNAGVAALRPRRREFLWFGVLAGLICLLTQVETGQPAGLTPPPAPTQRLWATLIVASVMTGHLFGHSLAGRALSRPTQGALGLGLGVVMVGLVLGPRAAPWLPLAVQAVVLLSTVFAAEVYLRALRSRTMGVPAVLLGSALIVTAALLERSLGTDWSRGLLTGSTVLFAVGTTMALFLRLAAAAEWYEEVVEQSRDAILVVGPELRVEAGNAAADALFERPVRGMPIASLLDAAGSAALGPLLRAEARGRQSELRLSRGSGDEVHVESVASPLPEGRVLLVLRDITSRRQLESSLVEAARRETAAIIAGGIAHDFNNAMGALLGNVEMMRGKADPASAKRLDRMEALIHRASMMTRRIISAVRGGEAERAVLAVEEPIRSAIELCRTMLPAEVTLEVDLEPDLPRVLGNADEIEQALLNLVLNARDAMPEGGGIRVSAARLTAGTGRGGLCVAVEDDGPGVPPELLERIWEPFFTTKGAGRGTGLGLAVVARVAREHGGSVEVGRAARGSGARFALMLPPAEVTATLTGGSTRVAARALVVDDDPDLREHMRAELGARGCEVVTAASAEEAEAAFDQARPAFDLLVSDVVLPGASGISLARRLGGRRPGLAVLIVSGFIPENEPALDPRWGRLQKPFTSEAFAVAVRRAMLRALRDQPGQG